MRAYELKIGNNGEYGLFKAGINNNTGLNIKFNINAYNDAISSGTPNTIEVFNLPLKYFINAKNYLGKSIYLSAGFDKSVLALKANYKNINCKLIYYGTILNVIPNYSDFTNPSVIFGMMMGSANQEAGSNAQQIKGKALTIKQNRLNTQELGIWLKNFLPKNFLVKFDTSLNNLNLQGEQTKIIGANNLFEALSQLEDLNVYSYTLGNELHLNYKKAKKQDNIDLSESSQAQFGVKQLGVNSYQLSGVMATASDLLPHIYVEDIIGMPQIINAVSIQLTIRLRADFKIGSLVVLPKNIIKANISDTSFGGVVALNGEMKVFIGGLFQVVGVNHIGEFYNTSPEAWITSLMLVVKS